MPGSKVPLRYRDSILLRGDQTKESACTPSRKASLRSKCSPKDALDRALPRITAKESPFKNLRVAKKICENQDFKRLFNLSK